MEISPNRVLIIDTAWLGDVIFSTSLIEAVKIRWPHCHLTVLVAPRGAPILQGHPRIDELLIFDKHAKEKSYLAVRRLAKRLHQSAFDVILNAHPSFRSRLLTRQIGSPIRVGYAGCGASRAFTHVVANDLAVEPDHVKRRIALLEALCGPLVPPPLHVPVLPAAAAWAEAFLQEHQAQNTPILALVPGSAWETKRWPLSHYKSLAGRWLTERAGHVLLIGGEAEKSLIAGLCAANPQKLIPVVSVPIPRVAALLARCRAVAGNDTGISLLAVAVGGPRTAILYGCTQVNYALPAPHCALTAGVPCCLPRTGHGAHQCRWSDEPWCMSQISVDRVWTALQGDAA